MFLTKKIKAKRPYQRPQGRIKGHKAEIFAGSDFLENDFRYTKGHLTKFWCATACNIALFQIWPKLLHKIVIFPTLRQFLATL